MDTIIIVALIFANVIIMLKPVISRNNKKVIDETIVANANFDKKFPSSIM